jgi:hypothetical protein
MKTRRRVSFVFALIGAIAATMNSPAAAEVYINELFWDAGGGSEGGGHLAGDDERDEYVELRGTPGMSLANHYLLFLESEDDSSQSGDVGKIDGFFDLGSLSMGTNGFFMLRQKGNLYDGLHGGVAPGTGGGTNAGTSPTWSKGWGNNFKEPGSSTVGYAWDTTDGRNQIENGGFTALLIDKGSGPTPTIGMALDGNVNNDNAELVDGFDPTPHDGLDYPGVGQTGWTIHDSIGVHAEAFEAIFGRTYAKLNFGTVRVGELLGFDIDNEPIYFEPNIEPDAEYVGIPVAWTEREIEYMGRWGNSAGQTEHDWHISNVTQRMVAGSAAGAPDYRQSVPDPHPSNATNPIGVNQRTESNQWVSYRTPILSTLGEDNYPLNLSQLPWDYNGDGEVNAADYTVWRDSIGQTGPGLAADGDGDQVVDAQDYEAWKYHFGESLPGSGGGAISSTVPEPNGLILALAGMFAIAAFRIRTC